MDLKLPVLLLGLVDKREKVPEFSMRWPACIKVLRMESSSKALAAVVVFPTMESSLGEAGVPDCRNCFKKGSPSLALLLLLPSTRIAALKSKVPAFVFVFMLLLLPVSVWPSFVEETEEVRRSRPPVAMAAKALISSRREDSLPDMVLPC